MKTFINLPIITFSRLLFFSCSDDNKHKKVGTAEELHKELRGVENERVTPFANIGVLEAEIINGGFNQYFFNSSGQNCFATLRLLKSTSKTKTAAILEHAIMLINPNKLSEAELIKKLRKREVDELNDDSDKAKLDSLDNEFFKSPDGVL